MDPLHRILALPCVDYPEDSDIDARYRKGAGSLPLRPVQRKAIAALEDAVHAGPGKWGPRGAVFPLGCGHGKALISYIASRVYGAHRPVLVVPASLVEQTQKQWVFWSFHYDLGKRPTVLSYEYLSSLGKQGTLERLRPDLVVLDEAHYLGSTTSARWLRIGRYLALHQDVVSVALSGTFLRASLEQVAHIYHACLKDWSPVPVGHTLEHWCDAIDVGKEPTRDTLRYLRPLLEWAGERDSKAGYRRAFRARVGSARGVVMSRGISADVSLRLELWKDVGCAPTSVHTATQALMSRWELPDGTLLVDALEYQRHVRTLPLGFYYRLVGGSDAWRQTRQDWGRHVKRALRLGRADSPGTAAELAKGGHMGAQARKDLLAWLAIRKDAPVSEVAWLDDGRDYVRYVVETYLYQCDDTDVLVWYQSRGVASVLGDLLPTYGQGTVPPSRGSAALSVRVHGTGANLQHWCNQLVLEVPSNGSAWEQLLARTHRPGQTRDVTARILLAHPLQQETLHRAEASARFLQDTTGEPQRLLYADRLTLD